MRKKKVFQTEEQNFHSRMLYFAGQNVLDYLYPGKILPFCRSDRAGQLVV